ncbi:VOC family protein [Nocardia inohanensis]|uniref:VOC family protein n=1 Tax=Nocardia inohanensis TaxID=209246 RepID=UPI00082F9E90|nr:VOC family protein [Nocardia inohanensis]
MTIQFNHTIVGCNDNRESARFWGDILGLEVGEQWGPFIPVKVANDVTFDFANVPPDLPGGIQPQHYAFLVSEAEFDSGYAKIQERGLTYWADPRGQAEGQINHNDGGRGIYFRDPAGHYLEMITVPYGGWPE